MSKKPMGKKTAVIVLAAVIVAAIMLGFILISSGDGPVMGMVLADRALENTSAYADAAKAHGDGIYLVVSNAFNDYQVDYETGIPQGKDLYATLHFVECPQGSEYTGRWVRNGDIVAEEKGTLSTGPEGVIAYMLDKDSVTGGSYTFELYDGDSKIFEYTFSVE